VFGKKPAFVRRDVSTTNMAQEPAYASDSMDELLDLSSSNAQAILIATASFLVERGIPLDEWTASLAQSFSRAWDEPAPWNADEFLDAILTNYRTLGATIIESTLAPDHAEAAIAGFPLPDLCADLDVDCAMLDGYFDIPAIIAEKRGLSWSWRRDGEMTRLTVTRQTG
jgi:hypothetical protein